MLATVVTSEEYDVSCLENLDLEFYNTTSIEVNALNIKRVKIKKLLQIHS